MGPEGTSQDRPAPKLTRYRSSFWSLFCVCMAWGIPAGFVAATVMRHGMPNVFGFTLSLGVAAGGAALFLAAAVACFTTDASDAGVRGFDSLSRRRFFSWDEIGAVRPINVGGLAYLRVFSADGGAPLWLPLFLANQREFEARVIASAPERNPLRAFFVGRARPGAAPLA